MSETGEATVNPDGSTTFETPPVNETAEDAGDEDFESPPPPEGMEEVAKGIDPAFYLIGFAIVVVVLYYFFVIRKKSKEDEDDFFSNVDGEKFDLKLPTEVDEYYKIKEKCEEAGWQPGQNPQGAQQNGSGPHRVLAQALMKRAIADIPIVQHIQKESPGMNRLYSQSMCSVKQWRSYQAAEALVSAEVDEVRAEADEIEPGWSQVIWRQAMQYHQMLKTRHEKEAKDAEEAARKQRASKNAKAKKVLSPEEEAKAKELAAEKAAEELIKAEEREQQSKKAFSGGSMKKGFLDKSGKKK